MFNNIELINLTKKTQLEIKAEKGRFLEMPLLVINYRLSKKH